MRLLLILLCVVVLGSSTRVEAEPSALDTTAWYWLHPRPTGYSLYDVDYVDAYTAVAVGEGTILRSEDGGATWRQLRSPVSYGLWAISFADEWNGLVVGDAGAVFRTTDGGESWVAQSSGTTAGLRRVSFPDPMNGTAIGKGGVIIRTTDGGATWTPHSAGAGMGLNDVDFCDGLTGMIVGGNTVLSTTDGGVTWTARAFPARNTSWTAPTLMDVDVIDASYAVMVGHEKWTWPATEVFNGVVYKTTDGGATWSLVHYGASWCTVAFADTSTGAIIGSEGSDIIFTDVAETTSDGGVSWQGWTLPYCFGWYGGSMSGNWRRYDLDFGDMNTAAVVGVSVGYPGYDDYGRLRCFCRVSAGYISHTTDGGQTWTDHREIQIESTLNDVFFLDDWTGWVVGDRCIYATVEGGKSWYGQTVGANLVDVEFTDELNGVAVGDSLFLRTADGGIHWTSRIMDVDLTAASFPDALHGYVISRSSEVVLRTTDGGTTWTQVLDRLNPRDVFFLDANHGWVLDSNYLYVTSDGGRRWFLLDVELNVGFEAIYFADALHGWIVGKGGAIYSSVNGGLNWTAQSSGTTGDLTDVAFSDAFTGFAVGAGGVLRTRDGGNSWTRTIPMQFNGVDATGRIVGNCARILSVIPGPQEAPPPPTSITEFGAYPQLCGGVQLQWETISPFRVLGFRILRQCAGVEDVWFPPDSMLASSARSYNDLDVAPGDYLYTLVVDLWHGGEIRSEPVTVTAEPLPPPPTITEFSGSSPQFGQVRLQWNLATQYGVQGFRLLRQRAGTQEVLLPLQGMLGPSERSWLDYVDTGREYIYTLIVYGSCVGEVRSVPDSVWVPNMPVIKKFSASPKLDRVGLSWEIEWADVVEGFRLQRLGAGAEDIWLPPDTVLGASARSYTDEDVAPECDYVYTLVVHLPAGYGTTIRSQPLAVTTAALPAITEFTAVPAAGGIRLDWKVDSQDIVEGFRAHRTCAGFPDVWIPADTLLSPDTRTVTDTTVTAGLVYQYRLTMYLTKDRETLSPAWVQVSFVRAEPVPSVFSLGQNQPNPFTPTTSIPYGLPERAWVTLDIFDIKGRRICTLVNESQERGFKSVPWDGRDGAGAAVPSGVYFYRLHAGSSTETRKMVLVR